MRIAIDTSAIIAVIVNQPDKSKIVAATVNVELIAPASVKWEIGNALSSLQKRGKISEGQIEEAIDGYEAGEKISSLIPTLVILDINLSGVGGFKICERIRRDKSLKKVMILAITGDPTEETKRKIIKAGANAFLPKPFGPNTLIKTVKKLADLNFQTNL